MKYFLVGAACLAVGFFGGFYLSNTLNRNAALQTSPLASSAPIQPQTQAASIKEPNAVAPAAALPGVQEALDKAKDEPQNFDAQLAAAQLFIKIRNFDKASEYFDAAAATKPSDPSQLVKLANGYYDAEKFEKAEPFYVQALEKNPNDLAARADLGVTFVRRATPDYDRAIREFDAALKINPKHEPTLSNIAFAYAKKGDAANGRRYADELARVNPSNPNLAKINEMLSAK